MSDNPTEQELYTLRALAEQAQNPNSDINQIMHHLQANMDAVNAMQQQIGSLQAAVHEQNQDHPQAQPALIRGSVCLNKLPDTDRATLEGVKQAPPSMVNSMVELKYMVATQKDVQSLTSIKEYCSYLEAIDGPVEATARKRALKTDSDDDDSKPSPTKKFIASNLKGRVDSKPSGSKYYCVLAASVKTDGTDPDAQRHPQESTSSKTKGTGHTNNQHSLTSPITGLASVVHEESPTSNSPLKHLKDKLCQQSILRHFCTMARAI
ncbi:hypothetical protein BGZ68_007619 [Mortierella alpina]|nr:hypothetical protein BGZ68_007619 [Mortierella alpina]